MTPVEHRVGVGGGVTLHVREWPRPSPAAPPGSRARRWLCVHGLASNARTWDGVAARLQELGHSVASVDLRGHGRSDKPDDGYDFPTFCADLVAVLDGLGWERAVVAGQSMGGNVAVDLAARHPGRVGAVAGVDGGAIDLQQRWPVWEDCLAALTPPRLEGTARSEIEAMLRRRHPDWPEDGVAATLANFETRPDGTVRPWLTRDRHLRLLRALWEHQPALVLPMVTVPAVLLVAGPGAKGRSEDDDSDDDAAAAAKAAEVKAAAAALRTLSVHWITGADHDVHVQQPRLVAELLHRTLP
jgi:pimeloyl-ACP methyl ester carboxylesterase